MSSQPTTEMLLDGYRVLDMSEGWHMFCGKLLGDMGADVIKIEKPGGSPSRAIGPFYKYDMDPEKSLFWFSYNTNKRGITLDIQKADGQVLLKQLAAKADFIIVSSPPGFMDSCGLGYPTLSRINPRIIMISMSPYGQKGPYANCAASDITTWAMGGQLYNTGYRGQAPLWYGYPQSGLAASEHAAYAAMLALWYRNARGEGQHIDLSMTETMVNTIPQAVADYVMNGRVWQRQGNKDDFMAPHGCYRCHGNDKCNVATVCCRIHKLS